MLDMSKKELDVDRIKQIIKQLSGKIGKKDKQTELVPAAIIKGTGECWYWMPTKNKFVCINRGIKIYIIDYTMDELDRVMAYDGYNMFMIPIDEIEEVGFN